jgi:hypothetical protein
LSQQFDASNSSSKSFDASNTATAQTFDGSNTLSSVSIDYSNSATLSGTVSDITNVDAVTDEITVQHTTENFVGRPLGTPLYYSVLASSGFFATNPRGVVFLKTTTGLGTSASTFQVSATPDGEVIDIVATFTGTFQLANQARTFAGNNRNPLTEIPLTIIKEPEFVFDGNNQGFAGTPTNGLSSVEGYTATILLSVPAGQTGLDYYPGAMLRYDAPNGAATGLVNGETYFVNSFVPNPNVPGLFNMTIRDFPDSTSNIVPSGGGTEQTFQKIGVSIDKDIIHIRDANFAENDLIEYIFPVDARFTTENVEDSVSFYYVRKAYDSSNFELSAQLFSPIVATGGQQTTTTYAGRTYNVHTFTATGNSTFTVTRGTTTEAEVLVVAGGGGGGGRHGGGGGGGGFITSTIASLSVGPYPIVIGAGGEGRTFDARGLNGGNSSAFGLTAIGGGGGGSWDVDRAGSSGGSGGGASYIGTAGSAGTAGQGFAGGNSTSPNANGGGGGGAGSVGSSSAFKPQGGIGRSTNITGIPYFFAAGGGGGAWEPTGHEGGNGGTGGGGGGGKAFVGVAGTGGLSGISNGGNGIVGRPNSKGGAGGANTGSGGGGGGATTPNAGYTTTLYGGGNGGSGIVIVRYPTTAPVPFTPANATGGVTTTVTTAGTTYRVHAFTATGASTFNVQSSGSYNQFNILVVGGGASGSGRHGGGGGAGGLVFVPNLALAPGTYNLTVGAGGIGARDVLFNGDDSQGGNSTFGTLITALGGGRPGNQGGGGGQGRSGGSGGGANFAGGSGVEQGGLGIQPSQSGLSGTFYGFGNRGGNAQRSTNESYPGGGGGGAGGAGESTENVNGGVGGIGLAAAGGFNFRDIFGTTYGQVSGGQNFFAGGGGGGVWNQFSPALGGIGGGGRGGNPSTGRPGADGTPGLANTGGGGGGGGGTNQQHFGGNGGSGIVLISYPIAVPVVI